ncbi:Leucine Rich repeat-containing protein [Flexibacter flexilis DSM 6793]|uniref:Leucine Rich repeat-containing protein n=1 Tax=Flexibacter flexilis DSM 6793 TaxID=927664 RepID=A0A1I1DC87_9BACT|nr:leucine-rich repeat domain-containing protein [Flexibacter flexilis]SFB72414.1 Leucine Rich repeat-containing protein [Flexibacter flexilis DSM 6793]
MELSTSITQQLSRLGIEIDKDTQLVKISTDETAFVVPEPMSCFLNSWNKFKKKLFFDKYEEGIPTNPIEIIYPDEVDRENQAISGQPFVSMFWDSHYSYYMLRADDPNPDDPDYYFLDHDDYESEELEPQGKLSDLLSCLYTREQANALVKEEVDEDEVEEIGLYRWICDTYGNPVERIKAEDCEIESLKGLDVYTDLKILSLSNNNISDISKLDALKNLEELSLNYNQITDISAVANKIRLKYFSIKENNVIDILALETCENLQILDLCNNKISDISPIKKLHQLKNIFLRNNPINDYSPLASLPKLELVTVSKISDDELAKLKQLLGEKVKIDNN